MREKTGVEGPRLGFRGARPSVLAGRSRVHSVPARTRIALLGLSVGIVLADSSVVTIALPEILAQYDVEIETLAWALTCAFAPSFGVLVGARTVQGVAGAALVCAALGLLAAAMGADAPAARIWAFAGILGAACGPAAGGILTQLFGWESIFVVQAPLLLLTLAALPGVRFTPTFRPLERPHLGANAALLLVSGALVAALFLLVILLINGWRLEPLAAGAVVTVMPISAILATRFAGAIRPLWTRAASGVILISGGLAALGWLPEAGVFWTIPPQLAVGAGLGLALSALTERALEGRSGQAVHGGW